MADFIKDEAKVGQMLRYLSGDIGLSFKDELKKLYGEPTIETDPVKIGEKCAGWHWLIIKYARSPHMARKYISFLQHCKELNVDPDEIKAWRKTMRIILPEEFMDKMTSFTQVPQLAIMDEGHGERTKGYGKDVLDSDEVLWARE